MPDNQTYYYFCKKIQIIDFKCACFLETIISFMSIQVKFRHQTSLKNVFGHPLELSEFQNCR